MSDVEIIKRLQQTLWVYTESEDLFLLLLNNNQRSSKHTRILMKFLTDGSS